MQACLDQGPRAKQYYSDMFYYYSLLDYTPAKHRSHNDKSQTYSVESVNADFRHYLRRFACRSKCFSRSLKALRLTITFLSIVTTVVNWPNVNFPTFILDYLTLYLPDFHHNRIYGKRACENAGFFLRTATVLQPELLIST
jgi:hypothetical protein